MIRSLFCARGLFVFSISLTSLSPEGLGAAGVELVRDGAALAKIYVDPADLQPDTVIPARDGRKLEAAIADFAWHVERMSGAKLEVVLTDDPDAVAEPALVVGTLAGRLGAEVPPSRWKEGCRLLVRGGKALVHGETPQASTYGLYALLTAQGCDWVMPGKLGEIIPHCSTVAVPESDASVVPAFGLRRFWYRGGPDIVTPEQRAELDLWCMRQRFGIAEELEEYGIGHMWDQFIARHQDEFQKYPEMLALVQQPDGSMKRTGPQIETTNPRVLELLAEDVRRTFKERNWPKDKAVTLPIGPADGAGYSVSPESLAANSGRHDPMAGDDDVSDLVAKLANDLLERIGGEFPNLSLGYFIYSVHADFPARYTPHPKIYPIFAPITYSRLHATTDENSFSRSFYRTILERWAALGKAQGNRFIIYEYNWNLADNMLPFTRLRMVGEDIPLYHRLGFAGVTIEATKAWALNGAHDYVLAKLLWNPSLDWKSLLHDYCTKAFGRGAPALERYYLRLVETQHGAGQEAGSYYSAPLIFDESYVAAARRDMAGALAQNLGADERVRVEAVSYTVETLAQYLAWHQALCRFDFSAAEMAYNEMLEGWKREHGVNPQLVAGEVPGYLAALMEASTTEGKKYSSAPYRIACRISDELPTCLDPTSNGVRMNLQGERINDAGWMRTRTFSSTWAAQGLGLYREGAVWYRFRFALPRECAGQPIGLFLGGFEDEALVWINGKPAGGSGIRFANPAVFDLTDGVRPEGENLLAIQVLRNSYLNENFLGGLLRPSFVFAGPRITPETPGAPVYRVLPGGERDLIKK